MAIRRSPPTFVQAWGRAALALSLGVLTSAVQAQAEVVLTYNTGVDSNQIVLSDGTPDPHYTLLSVPSGPLTAPVAKTIGAPLSPLGGWAAPSSTSAWITPTAAVTDPPPPNGAAAASVSGDGPVGDYLYRTTFDLTGYDLNSPVFLVGQWAADNTGLSVRLNSGDLITSGFGSYTAVPDFGFTDANFVQQVFYANTGFVAGINTLEFLIHNNEAQTGLRVEYELSAVPAAVPEPASWGLMALGLLGLGLTKRLRGHLPRPGLIGSALALLFACAGPAQATLVPTYNTGTLTPWPTPTLAPLSSIDAHYNRVLAPTTAGAGTPIGTATVLPSIPTGWLSNTSTSQWIYAINPAAPFSTEFYETSFDLSSFLTPTAVFSGSFGCNGPAAKVYLNGKDLLSVAGSYGSCTPSSLASFSFNGLQTTLNPGINYLTFQVTGGASAIAVGPNALIVEYRGDAQLRTVPEPASLALTGLALLGAGLAQRRRHPGPARMPAGPDAPDAPDHRLADAA